MKQTHSKIETNVRIYHLEQAMFAMHDAITALANTVNDQEGMYCTYRTRQNHLQRVVNSLEAEVKRIKIRQFREEAKDKAAAAQPALTA